MPAGKLWTVTKTGHLLDPVCCLSSKPSKAMLRMRWMTLHSLRVLPSCETRQDTWRIKRTREGQRLTGKAPSKTMGVTTDGTRDVDGCDDGGKGREGSQGKTLSLELRLPLSIPPKEIDLLDYILSLGHLRCPRTCMRSSPHVAAPYGPNAKGDGSVPPKRGTKWLRNAGKEM